MGISDWPSYNGVRAEILEEPYVDYENEVQKVHYIPAVGKWVGHEWDSYTSAYMEAKEFCDGVL